MNSPSAIISGTLGYTLTEQRTDRQPVPQTDSTQMKTQQSFSTTSQPFQLEITELLLLLRTISCFPNFLFAFLLLLWGWNLLCHIHNMHIKELKTAFWQRVSSVFHGFHSASEPRLTGIRVPGNLPSIINFSVSNVMITFVSILVNCYDSKSFFYNLSYWSSQNKILYKKLNDSRLVRKTLFSFSVLWMLHISGWWK